MSHSAPGSPVKDQTNTSRIVPDVTTFHRTSGRAFVGGDVRWGVQWDRHTEGEWQGDFNFVVMADIQLGLQTANFPMSGSTWDDEREMATRCVEEVNRLQPRFVVVCGDFVDAMPYTGREDDRRNKKKEQDPVLHQRQTDDFKAVFSRIDPCIPLVCVCGNHDVSDIPNRRTITDYGQEYGDDYFAFWCGGVRCIVLNTMMYNALEKSRWEDPKQEGSKFSVAEKAEAQELARAQHTWLTREVQSLQGSSPTHVLAFSHLAPFLYDANEPKGYYNLEPAVS